jgi:serralysin
VVINQAYNFNASTFFSDPDAGDVLSYSATGLPVGLSINGAGVISGTVTATGSQSVTVTATDTAAHTTQQTFTLTEVAAPVFNAIAANVTQAKSGDALTFTVTVSEIVTVASGTPTISLNVGGHPLTATYSGGTGTNTLTFTATAPVLGDSAAVTISTISLNGATVTGNVSHQALITASVGQTVGSFVIDNTNPAFTSGATASFAENATTTAYATVASDATALQYSLSGTDAGLFNINTNTGAVTFKAAPDFEGSHAPAYAVSVIATDALGHTNTQAVTITVTNVNETPTLTSGTTASFAENASTAVYSAVATDPDASTVLTYTLGGADAALFNINASSGVVTFKASPNYEAPADAGANNVYDVSVSASDGTITTAAKAVAITVTNVNEAPTSSTVTPATVVINQAYNFNASTFFSDPDAGDVLSYSATGLPVGLSINSAGVISGTVTATGSQSVTVTATDTAAHTTSQTFDLHAYAAPALTSSVDNTTNFEVTSNIVMTSTEHLTAVTGKYIHIFNDGGTGLRGEAVTNTQDILVTDANHVSIVNNTITINPGFDLDFANNYHIMVDAGAFTGASSGLASVATVDATVMNFGTVAPTNVLSGGGSASQAMVSNTDALVAGHTWFDAEGNSNPAAVASVLDMSAGSIAIAATDFGTGGIATNDFYVALTNFASGDLIYFDNHGDNSLQRQSEFDAGIIVAASNNAPTWVAPPASGTVNGTAGGQFDVTVANSNAYFLDIAGLKVLMGGVSYEPILYG